MEELKFEDALQRLEGIVTRLEAGDLPLEEALAVFEEGVRLTKLCSQRLTEAERKVSILLKNAEGRLEERPFDPAQGRPGEVAPGRPVEGSSAAGPEASDRPGPGPRNRETLFE